MRLAIDFICGLVIGGAALLLLMALPALIVGFA